jgi:hypothetical protein
MGVTGSLQGKKVDPNGEIEVVSGTVSSKETVNIPLTRGTRRIEFSRK